MILQFDRLWANILCWSYERVFFPQTFNKMNSYVGMVDMAFLPVLLITCPCASSRNTNRLLNNKQCARPLCQWWQTLHICCWQAIAPSFLHYFVCGYVTLWTRAALFEEFEVPVWFIGLWNFRVCIRPSLIFLHVGNKSAE